jgi:tetratricopeptide (TPR) repeat protein
MSLVKSNKTLSKTLSISKFQINLVILLLLSSFNVPKSFAQTTIKFGGVDTLINKAINLVYHQEYSVAMAMCDQVIENYPDNPMGYLGKAAVYHIIMLNYRVSLFENQFDSLITLAIKTGEKAIKKYKDDANAYFVLGAAYGFRGLNRIRKGQWFGAFRDGVRGISHLMKAHEMKKDLYDVYYGLGLYYYWKSAKAKVLTFLLLMKDEREKGIEYLKISIEKGNFSSTEAVFALIEIYYYEDRYEEALEEALSLKDKFSNDPTWNYLTAKILEKLGRWQESKKYFSKLLNLLEASQYQANSYLAECHYGIAKSSYELGDYETARRELRLAIELSKRWDKEKELEGPLLDFDKVLDRMNKLNLKLTQLDGNK